MRNTLLTVMAMCFFMQSEAQNVGIGTTTPGFKLDVNGRMRIRHVAGSTAGIWLDGPTLPTRSFIGTVDDDHVGIYGNGGASWNLVMNVENGNTGIGTNAPTARLDVNGTVRLRSNDATAGAVLRSADGNGNVSWQRPAAFRVRGMSGNETQMINAGAWTKVMFFGSAEYNEGFHYQPLSSVFSVPVSGIYHFDLQLLKGLNYEHYLRIEFKRGNSYFELARTYTGESHLTISTDAKLQAGDEVFVSFLSVGVVTNLLSNTNDVWFAGRLVSQL